jgi:tetratricopeptide (TPR) repeat protein
MGELDRAQAALERVILFLQRCGAQRQMTADLGNLGLVYLSRGDLARAEEWMLRHIEHARLTGFLPEVYRGNTNLAAVSFYQGDYARALEMYTVNSAYFEQRGSREGFELDRLWIACCHSHLGDREGPPAAARAVLSQAREIRSEVLETLALRCLASFLPCRERLPYLLESYALSSRLGRMFEQAAALLALAEAETGEMGAGYWEQGAALLRRIGATAWLEGRARENPPFLPMFV